MNLAALLTSAGINVGICTLLLSLYSISRKQPGNASVYFGRTLAEERSRRQDSLIFERLLPLPSWIIKTWKFSEDEVLDVAGLDAVVFIRILILRLWVHCLSLCIISCSACALLYFEYQRIARVRLLHITRSSYNPSHFVVLVRAIPRSKGEAFNDSVRSFFTKYHASSYLSHQLIFRVGKVHKIMNNAEKAYKKLASLKGAAIDKKFPQFRYKCGLCGGTSNPFYLYDRQLELMAKKTDPDNSNSVISSKEHCNPDSDRVPP